jgi:hypothetical protein
MVFFARPKRRVAGPGTDTRLLRRHAAMDHQCAGSSSICDICAVVADSACLFALFAALCVICVKSLLRSEQDIQPSVRRHWRICFVWTIGGPNVISEGARARRQIPPCGLVERAGRRNATSPVSASRSCCSGSPCCGRARAETPSRARSMASSSCLAIACCRSTAMLHVTTPRSLSLLVLLSRPSDADTSPPRVASSSRHVTRHHTRPAGSENTNRHR